MHSWNILTCALLCCPPTRYFGSQSLREDQGLCMWGLFSCLKKTTKIQYLLLIRWPVADTHHNITDFGLPSDSDPLTVIWLVTRAWAELRAALQCSRTKSSSTSSPSCPVFTRCSSWIVWALPPCCHSPNKIIASQLLAGLQVLMSVLHAGGVSVWALREALGHAAFLLVLWPISYRLIATQNKPIIETVRTCSRDPVCLFTARSQQ